MSDIEKQAKLVLLGAKVRAEQLLAAAQEEADQLKRQAHAQALADGKKEGFAKGFEEGRKQGREEALNEQRQELANLLGALRQSCEELDSARVMLESQAKQAVVDLSIAIARRVTKRSGQLDPRVALANIDEALRLVVHGQDVRIAVHPAQRAMLSEVLPRIQAQWPNLQHVEIIADGTLSPGGCRIFSGGGQIDGDLEIQLDRLARELVPQPEDDQ